MGTLPLQAGGVEGLVAVEEPLQSRLRYLGPRLDGHGVQLSWLFVWLSELSSWPSEVPSVVSCCDTGLFAAGFSCDWKLLAADLRLDCAWPEA